MESKELSKSEEAILYKVVEEYQENGKLHYIGNKISYRISCENESKCGIWLSIRGI